MVLIGALNLCHINHCQSIVLHWLLASCSP